MRALFIGPSHTREMELYTDAWDFWNAEPARDVTFETVGARRDDAILAAAAEHSPQVIFYIGGAGGSGLPSVDTLCALRAFGKTIHLCCDSTDSPWHPFLREYAGRGCFDLQVGTDGPLEAPVDLAVMPPINPASYDVQPAPARDIRCGFAGQFMEDSTRGRMVMELVRRKLLTVTMREFSDVFDDARPYAHYVNLMRRYQIAFNIGFTTIDDRPMVKWRPIEAALAGAALLENDSPVVDHWFTREAVFHYSSAAEASTIILLASDAEIQDKAGKLSEKVRRDYRPQNIYGQMLERVGL